MPSLGMMTVNALAAADSVLIPVQAQYLPVKGLEQLLQTVAKIQKQINPHLKIDGILLTMVDARTNYSKEIIALLHETYGGKLKIFENNIPLSVRAAEISAEGKSIYAHDPHGKVAKAYVPAQLLCCKAIFRSSISVTFLDIAPLSRLKFMPVSMARKNEKQLKPPTNEPRRMWKLFGTPTTRSVTSLRTFGELNNAE
jgi:hypothetical protein